MTSSGTSLVELTVGEVITDAYGLSGLMNEHQTPNAVQNTRAMRFLRATLSRLQAKGIYVRAMDFSTVTLTSGTASYTAATGTLDYIGDAVFRASTGSTDIVVRPILEDEYHRLSNKTSTGTPRLYYAHRVTDPLTVYLWPVPDQTNSTVKFQRHKLLDNVQSTTDTFGIEQHWSEYLQWDLAHKLANAGSLTVEVRGYIRGERDRAYKDASGYSRQRGPTQIHLDHGTPWRA